MRMVREIRRVLEEVLPHEEVGVGVWIASRAQMEELNKEYRGKEGVTDVLSFPAAYDGVPSPVGLEDVGAGVDLGDIVLCPDGFDPEIGVDRVVVHSLCHLLGHDHEDDDEWRVMVGVEDRLLARCSVPYPPIPTL